MNKNMSDGNANEAEEKIVEDLGVKEGIGEENKNISKKTYIYFQIRRRASR